MAKNNNPGRILKGTKTAPSLKSASGVWTLDEALQAHRANQWPQPNLFQPVANSIRNSLGKTSYISRESPGRSGSQRKFTFSWWLKKNSNATSSQQHLHYSYDGSRLFQIFFERGGATNPDCICVYGGSTDVRFIPVVRDTSAWYHIVIAVDIDQATSTNTIKCWINGVQITTTGTQGGSPGTPSWPTSATNWPINQAGVYQRIGGNAGGGTLDGQFAEINFVDGAQLQPTLFGQFDTNNTWVPIAYTGSYGTNGFYLPFTNATTSQTLGYDASLNGTTTYTADQDPYRSSVALHLTGNGPAGGNNNVFADSSSTNNAISRTGNVTQGSFSPYPLPTNAPYNPAINGASAYFPKSGWLSAPTAAVSSIGTGDFTFESWVYPIDFTLTSLYQRWFSFGTGLSSDVTVNIDNSGYLVFRINDATQLTSATTLTANTWNHVAFVRSSGTVRFYINGVSGNSASVTTNLTTQGGNAIIIGAEPGQSQGSAGDFYGYMSNFRVIKGAAVYTANFTPTNRPFGTLTNNLLNFSESLENSSVWSTVSGTVTASAEIAPDGTPTATRLVATTTDPYIYQPITLNGTYTLSCWIKGTGPSIGKTGTLRISGQASTFPAITKDWQRISATFTVASGSYIAGIEPPDAGAAIGDTVYLWGFQLEVGGAMTNYTPTPANYSTAPSLLLNFANAAVVDSAGANNVITVNSSTISSASKFGGGALSFNGVTDYMLVPPNPAMAFGTGAFTIEFWHYSPTIGGNTCLIDMQNGLMIRQNSNNSILTYSRATSTQLVVTPNNTLMPNVWSHVAVTRLGTTMTVWINGQNQGQWSLNDSLTQTANTYIGAFINNQVAPQTFTGQLDDIRITAGVARYQANFTPPARALPEVGGKSFTTVNVNAGVVRSFTTTGTTAWTAPSDVTQVEVLVVAGGGSGMGGNGGGAGGGGAGGLIYNNQYSVTPGQTYTVTVGAGGAAKNGTGTGNNGSNSVFGSLTAIGGGGGGSNGFAGVAGGSGGGSGEYATPDARGYGGAGTAGQGFAGGNTSQTGVASGGGGAGGLGGNGSNSAPGSGGAGLLFGISGAPQYYAGGGGASGNSLAGAAGGSGVGGNGGAGSGGSGTVTAGATNTGSGGGGIYVGASGAGGSGIVIVRYTTQAVGNTSDATTDNLVDSPTLYGHDTGAGGEVVGNYATWNPLDTATSYLKNGNLSNTAGGANKNVRGTIAVSSGKWYWEFTIDQASPTNHHGIWSISETTTTYYIGQTAGSWGMYDSNGNKRNNGSFDAYGSAYTLNDIGMVALDMDNGKIWWGKNGTWFNSGVPASGTNAAFTNLGGYIVSPATLQYSAASYNFGQRAWAYTPPAGFNAINTKNLPRPTVGSAAATPNQHFSAIAYTGTGATRSISSLNFQPDFVLIKDRSSASYGNKIYDSIRGAQLQLEINGGGAEASSGATSLTSLDSNGFTLGSYAGLNGSGDLYVAWCFKAGGTAVSNTAGTITSSVSANTTSGFSIVSYAGNNTTGATIGHGLGVTPSFVIVKNRTAGNNFRVYHSAVATSSTTLYLNTTDGLTANGDNVSAVSSTTFTVGSGGQAINQSANNYIAYCWAEVAGFSKFGKYDGNSSTDGPFIYCGFKPALVIIKGTFTAAASQWYVYDNARDPISNPVTNRLLWNDPSADTLGTTTDLDFVANGFKLRYPAGGGGLNSTGSTYIYMAFAANSFGNTNGTAR